MQGFKDLYLCSVIIAHFGRLVNRFYDVFAIFYPFCIRNIKKREKRLLFPFLAFS